MRSKERVLRIFRGESVDRLACFEQTIACSVASDILGRPALTSGSSLEYHEARAWWEGEEAHDAFKLQVLKDNLELSEELGFDMVRPRLSVLESKPSCRINEYTFGFGNSQHGTFFTMSFDPNTQIWGMVKKPVQCSNPYSVVHRMQRILEHLTDETTDSNFSALDWLVGKVGDQKAVLCSTGEISIPIDQEWLIACADDPGIVERYLDCIVEISLRKLPFVKKHGADVIWAGGLIGGSDGPVYSPEIFKHLLLPRLKRIVTKCHELGLFYVYRTDGNIWSIAEKLLGESGIDGYGVSDIDAGMDIGDVRKRFPKLVLCGNVNNKTLQLGTVEQVKAETRACVDKALGGGHIFGSSNSIIHGTPADNVIAMFETAREYGRY